MHRTHGICWRSEFFTQICRDMNPAKLGNLKFLKLWLRIDASFPYLKFCSPTKSCPRGLEATFLQVPVSESSKKVLPNLPTPVFCPEPWSHEARQARSPGRNRWISTSTVGTNDPQTISSCSWALHWRNQLLTPKFMGFYGILWWWTVLGL